MKGHPNRSIACCLVLGAASFLFLPWYAIQDGAWYLVLPQVWGGPESANGVMQASLYGRGWLWCGVAGLALASVALLRAPAISREICLVTLKGKTLSPAALRCSGMIVDGLKKQIRITDNG